MISISFKILWMFGVALVSLAAWKVMKARAAANVRRAAPGPTATSLFASDVCLGELALERARCRHCHLHKVRLNGTCVPSRYISGKCFPSFGREYE